MKGLGFFLGAALLALLGFEPAVLAMAAVLAAILVAVLLFMPAGLPRGRKGTKFWRSSRRTAHQPAEPGAHVPVRRARRLVRGRHPVYFYAVLSDGTEAGNRAAFFLVGSFIALWIIAYGAVQAAAPRLLRAAKPARGGDGRRGAPLGRPAAPVPSLLAAARLGRGRPAPWLTATLIAGLLLFGSSSRSTPRSTPT